MTMQQAEMRKVTEIVWRQDLYPRFEPNQKQIQRYSESIEFLPPIKINQANILIDGFHRWKAFQLAGVQDVPCQVVETASEKELKRMAYELNSNHGLQLSDEEKRQYAQEMYGDATVADLARTLSVSEKSIRRWTTTQAKAAKQARDRQIVDLYLRAANTQEQVAEWTGTPQQTVADVIRNTENGQLSIFGKTFKPFLYNIWNAAKQDNARAHFGAFPEQFMENRLYYHTEPLDVVYNPFGGGVTTVDVCKRMFRRYYVSDRRITPGRENDIREWQIQDGLPEDLPLPTLAFLDPPYWSQAEGKYSQDDSDLGNMSLEAFNETMRGLLVALVERRTKQIAIVIQPTQYKNDWQWTDHIFDFAKMLPDRYRITARYILPYSTQQYLPQMVNKAKDEKRCLGSHRDLVVWSLS